MDEASKLDFLSAFGEEFCEALSPPVSKSMIVPQDSYEVWVRAFGDEPTPAGLTAVTEEGIEKLRTVCEKYFESTGLGTSQILLAIERTLTRWSSEDA